MTTSYSFTISAFGDEIDPDLETQLRVLNDLDIGHLELRGAWGKNVLEFSNEEAARVRDLCAAHGVQVSAIGSPIGKSPLMDPIEKEEANLERIFQIARIVGTDKVRIFSFYPPISGNGACFDDYVDEAIASLSRLVTLAEAEGFTLLLENEKGIVGDTLDRCVRLMNGLPSPAVVFLWDPANFVQVGEERVTERGWPLLGDRVGYVHIKDCTMDGRICAAGEGDGQVPELIQRLREKGYHGFLALEPHLAIAGHSSGFSGPDGMAYAVRKLREVLGGNGGTEGVWGN